ncbi:MAG: zf-HC2 domain-containing protein, partial [Planctomycetota bacterium]
MRCDEVHEYLFAYLDNELDVPVSMELQRHVETCHECAREVEIEWAIKGKLSEVLSREPVDVEF